MSDWQNIAVLTGVTAFAAFLVWRMRPMIRSKAIRAAAQDVAEARKRALGATTARDRAQALCDVARALSRSRASAPAAVSYLVRAMRADPTWPEPIAIARELLFHKNPRSLEKLLWRRLAVLECSGPTCEPFRLALHTLADLYAHALHDRTKSDALGRLADRMPSDAK